MPEQHQPTVSVIVPAHNDGHGLRLTLDALARVRVPAGGFEVVVADDRSTEDLSPVLAGRPNVRRIVNDGTGGSYGARNAGVRASRGRILAFTDADCEPDPGWLEAIVEALEAEPGIVVAGKIRMPLAANASLAAMVDVTCHLDQERCVRNESYAVTANIACSREIFDRIGPFAELQSSGDREWTGRAQRKGAPLRYIPEASLAHPPRVTGGELWRKSRRVGLGSSVLRHEVAKELRAKPMYLQRGWLRPRHRDEGLVRVRENGAQPSRLRWFLTGAAQLAFVQYPQVLFAARSDLLRALRLGR